MSLTVMAQQSKIKFFDNERLKNSLTDLRFIVEHLSSADIDDDELQKVKIFQQINPVH